MSTPYNGSLLWGNTFHIIIFQSGVERAKRLEADKGKLANRELSYEERLREISSYYVCSNEYQQLL